MSHSLKCIAMKNYKKEFNEIKKEFEYRYSELKARNFESHFGDAVIPVDKVEIANFLTHHAVSPSFKYPVYSARTGTTLVDGRKFINKKSETISKPVAAQEATRLAVLDQAWNTERMGSSDLTLSSVFAFWAGTAVRRMYGLDDYVDAIMKVSLFLLYLSYFKEDYHENALEKNIADYLRLPNKAIKNILSLNNDKDKTIMDCYKELLESRNDYNSLERLAIEYLDDIIDIIKFNDHYIPNFQYEELVLIMGRNGWVDPFYSTFAIEHPGVLAHLAYQAATVTFYKNTGIANALHLADRSKRGLAQAIVRRVDELVEY